jgi:hypothetical protein
MNTKQDLDFFEDLDEGDARDRKMWEEQKSK